MIAKIVPIPAFLTGTYNALEIVITSDDCLSICRTVVSFGNLVTMDGKEYWTSPNQNVNVNIEGDDYTGWNGSNDSLKTLILSRLNLTERS